MSRSTEAPSKVASPPRFDAVVVGAGITGIYALHQFVDMGLNVKLVEAGSGVGGTWYWNRYPGARFDSESYSYGYYHDKELLQEWDWSEEFTSQEENERYLNHAVDRWDLRKHMQFDTTVTGAVYDESAGEWEVSLSTGDLLRCQYFVPCVGLLSATYTPDFPNLDSYAGELLLTSRWPKEPVDFKGKKVAVIGTGASGVQAIPKIAEDAESLTVFQRTANWAHPLNNRPISAEEMASIKASYDKIWEKMKGVWMSFPHDPDPRKTFEVSDEERLAKFEELYYQAGGLRTVSDHFADMARDEAANAAWCEFFAERIRERVKDPATAEKLIPKHLFGNKRPPGETNYYETYNRDNVELIDVNETPIVTFTPSGIETTDRAFDFDAVVLATGFDAVTGAVLNLNVKGLKGLDLRDAWREGPKTLYGVAAPGFPNLLMAGGPHVGAGNVFRATELQVNMIRAAISHAQATGNTTIMVTEEAATEFTKHVLEAVEGLNLNSDSNWYTGGNIPGKVKVYSQYSEGIPEYRRRIDKEIAEGFPGLVFTSHQLAEAN